jgi:hypothetical protein
MKFNDMTIDAIEKIEFNLDEIVYLKSDQEQVPRIINGILLSQGGCLYSLSCGEHDSWHYGNEITRTKNLLFLTS